MSDPEGRIYEARTGLASGSGPPLGVWVDLPLEEVVRIGTRVVQAVPLAVIVVLHGTVGCSDVASLPSMRETAIVAKGTRSGEVQFAHGELAGPGLHPFSTVFHDLPRVWRSVFTAFATLSAFCIPFASTFAGTFARFR